MKEIAQKILRKKGVDFSFPIKKKIRGLPGIEALQLVEQLLEKDSLVQAANSLGYTENPVKEASRTLSSLLGITTSHLKWRTKLLSVIDYMWCNSCSTAKNADSFSKDSTSISGLQYICSSCNTIKSKKHKFYILDRTPPWADLEEIAEFYANCPIGYHVDHIIPLRGQHISGLHVISNLQYLTQLENLKKSNTFNLVP